MSFLHIVLHQCGRICGESSDNHGMSLKRLKKNHINSNMVMLICMYSVRLYLLIYILTSSGHCVREKTC